MELFSYAISGIISVIIAFLTAYAAASYRIGRLEGMIESIGGRINQLENRFDNFIPGVYALIYKKEEPQAEKLIKEFDEFRKFFVARKNPISEEELARIDRYRDKIAKRKGFTFEEYQDFKFLAKKMSEEFPKEKKEKFDLIMAGLLGFAAGLTFGALLSKLSID